MKLGYLFSIAIIPGLIFATNTFNFQGKGKDKDEHSQKEWKGNSKNDQGQDKGNGNRKNENHENHENHGNKNDSKAFPNKGKDQNKGNDKKSDWKSDNKGRFERWDDNNFDNRLSKLKNHKKGKWSNNLNYGSVNWWDGNDIYNAKKPKSNKKVAVCHKPDGSDNPVNIQVSVNALKAHLNHGDSEGECNDFDQSRYSDNYWNTRNEYYNQYVSTTETMSFGEQLLAAAIDKLTNGRTQLAQDRNRFAAADLERREMALLNLQNDTYQLQQSLERGNERVVNVNLVF